MNPEERIVEDRKYITFYMDDDENAIDKEYATKCIARVEDLNGNILEETFGLIAPKQAQAKNDEKDEDVYFTQDEYDRLKQINEEKGWGMDFSRIRVRQTIGVDAMKTKEELARDGFNQQVIDTFSLLNNGKSAFDGDYIQELRKNPVARAVMAADMEMHEPDQWTKFATKEGGRIELKRRFIRAVLEKDEFDYTGKRIKKRFQLDHERLFFLTVVYTDDGVHHYTIDVEKASDSHYELSAEAGRQLQKALNPKLSLWEGLMLYLEDHGEGSLLSLMDRENIKYSQMHFTFWGDWDE